MQKLSEKVAISGFALGMLLLGEVTAESYFQVQQLDANRRSVQHTYEVLESIHTVFDSAEQVKRERRSYVLSNGKDVTARAEFWDSVTKSDRAIAQIQQLTKDNFDQQRRLDVLKPLIAKRIGLLQQSLDLIQQKRVDQSTQTEISKQSLSLHQEIESELQAMITAERTLLESRSAAADSSVQRTVWLNGIGYTVGFSLLIGIFSLLLRQIREAKRDEVVRRQAERSLQHANDRLEATVHTRTMELTHVNALLKTDLTERKLVAQALLESEKQLRLITDALPVLISYLDVEQRYRFNNRTYEEWFGASHKDLTGKYLRDMVGDSYPTIQPYAEAVLAGQHVDYEFEIPSRDGGSRWVHATYIPDFGEQGDVKGYFALISDISEAKRYEAERQQSEAQIRQSEARLRLVLQNMPVMLDAFDENWNIIEWNRDCERVTGYQADEVVGNPQILELLYPNLAYRQQMMQAWGDRGNNYRSWEWDITCKDGSIKTISWSNISDQFPIPGWASWGIGVDISDRKQAENQLRQSEERLSLAIEGSGMATWDVDIQADTVLWSEQHFKLLGYDPVPGGKVLLEQWRSRVHPEDRAKLKRASVQAQQERSPYRIEHRIIRADTGEVVWVAAFGRVIYNQAGQAVRFVGILLDISDRKMAEQEVLQLNQSLNRQIKQLETLLEVIPIGIGIAQDPDCQTIKVNPTFAKQLGIPPTINASLSAPPDEAPTFKVYQNGKEMLPEELPMQVAATHGLEVTEVEVDVVHADGRVVTLLEYAAPLLDEQNQIIGCVGAFLDITDRKRAQETLQESERLFATLAEASPTGIFRFDTENNCLYVNRRWSEMTGRPIESALGMGWLQALHPDELDRLAREWQQWCEKDPQEQGIYKNEGRHIHVDGSINWYYTQSLPYLDNEGILTGYVGTLIDITDLKQAEESLKRMNEELELKVQERTANLNQANEDLLRSNQELEQFAYIASHDLQEPLRAISGYTQLLATGYTQQLDETGQQYAAYVIEGAARMQQLIQDLLEYSRVGTRDLMLTPTDCNVVLRQVLSNLQVAIAESNATITADPLPIITADKTQIIQLFQNLIGNAIKFRREEPSQIHISSNWSDRHLRSRSVSVEDMTNGKSLTGDSTQPLDFALTSKANLDSASDSLFSIRDNGIGIKPRYLERIFQIFKRLHTRREFPGTGIGLAICKKIVDRHKGHIWATSEPGIGTTFYFTIPHPAHGHSNSQLDRDSVD